MQQTVTVAGKSVTLTQGVATPSETRFYLYSRDVQLDQGNNFSLTDNGRNVNGIDGSVGGITNQDGYLTFLLISRLKRKSRISKRSSRAMR